ncbi:NmrA family NAD(P)-binding protein [Radicibacter daui]|uniref:NmrA family NAD(P)-binding protein n=1 Tax=Radicibacter daui TaxID=3064829 RepID=UPI004046E66E
MSATTPRLLVTGASGKLGHATIAHLLGSQKVPASQIVAGTRKPETLADLAAQGVEVRKVDFEDAAGLAAAFAGIDRLLVISTDALEQPGQRLAQHKAAIAAAEAAGVAHVIYTSMPKPEPGNPVLFAPDHWGTEQALEASKLAGWTVLRNNWYFENIFMSAASILASGHWYTAAGEGRYANVGRDDCAAVAAAVLANPPAGKVKLDVTGGEALTVDEVAALLSGATGKPVEVVKLTSQQLAEGMAAAGVPAPWVPLLVSFDDNGRAGGFNLVSDTVERLTGRKPQKYKDFLVANAKALAG